MEDGEDIRRSSSRKEKKKRKRRLDAEVDNFSEETAIGSDTVEDKNRSKTDGKSAPSAKEDFSRSAPPAAVLSVKMESFSESGNKIAPLVGYFPSGFNPVKRQKSNGEDGSDDMKIKVFRNSKFSNRLQLVVSPEQSKVEFVGTSYLGEAAAPQVCTYALGVLDKEKKTLKIVPIAANKIFRLEPRVRVPQVLNEEDHVAEMKANKSDLTNVFGTKDAKKWTRKWNALRRKELDPESQREMDSKIEDVEMNKEALEGVSVHVGNIPPHDDTATTLEKAYPLDKIILEGEWDHLSDVMDLMQSCSTASSAVEFSRKNAYPTFVCNRIHKLVEIEDWDEKKNLASIFSFMTNLIRFRNLSKSHKQLTPVPHSTSAQYHNIPTALFQRFVGIFSDSPNDRMSKDKSDLLISYILVLALFADGFEINITDIAKDLKMAPIDVRPYFLHLGCKSAGKRSSLVLALRVPLQFPKLRLKRKR